MRAWERRLRTKRDVPWDGTTEGSVGGFVGRVAGRDVAWDPDRDLIREKIGDGRRDEGVFLWDVAGTI